MTDRHLRRTELLNFDALETHNLHAESGRDLSCFERIGAAYDIVRNKIAFGYKRELCLCDDPNAFYGEHRQMVGVVRGRLCGHAIRHWMNDRVGEIRHWREAPPADTDLRAEAR
ncbi:hypothetical protein [Pseudotabrizicola sp. 4114]|uniref:hypothetical protein n=1 Tax=Pseudotabrizicola sp. 4114 TaxID=2817731 RepID=UPI00285FFD4B|nr:hypothetical protein [Pseudorhodobacter sp. 4114]